MEEATKDVKDAEHFDPHILARSHLFGILKENDLLEQGCQLVNVRVKELDEIVGQPKAD